MVETKESMPDPVSRTVHRPLRVLTAALGHFVHDVYSSFFAPLLPILREQLSLSYEAIGWLAALNRVPALASPLLGWFADRQGGRWMMVAAPSVTAVAMSLIGIAPSRLALGAMLLIAGIGSAIWHVPAPVWLAQLSNRRKGLGMSLFMVAGEGARTVGPLVALSAVTLWGPEGLIHLIPFGLLTSALLIWATADGSSSRAMGRRRPGQASESWKPLVRLFLPVTLILGGRSFLVASLATYLPSYVIEKGGSLWLGGAALAILQGAGAFGALLSGTLSDRLGRRTVLLTVAILSPPALLALVHGPQGVMLPMLVILGLLAFSTNPPLLALVQERAGSRPAVANGIFMTLSFTLRSGVLVLVGMLADHRGLSGAFAVSAWLAVSAIAGVWALPSAPTKSQV
jgi:FSR family fosmidomycin resistance protein-like MFS transporter